MFCTMWNQVLNFTNENVQHEILYFLMGSTLSFFLWYNVIWCWPNLMKIWMVSGGCPICNHIISLIVGRKPTISYSCFPSSIVFEYWFLNLNLLTLKLYSLNISLLISLILLQEFGFIDYGSSKPYFKNSLECEFFFYIMGLTLIILVSCSCNEPSLMLPFTDM